MIDEEMGQELINVRKEIVDELCKLFDQAIKYVGEEHQTDITLAEVTHAMCNLLFWQGEQKATEIIYQGRPNV